MPGEIESGLNRAINLLQDMKEQIHVVTRQLIATRLLNDAREKEISQAEKPEADLPPCPHCGSTDIATLRDKDSLCHYLYCCDCCDRGPHRAVLSEAYAAWSRRAEKGT